MASTPAAGADRVSGAPGRSLRGSAGIPALATLLLAGLALRLTIAYVLFPESGFATDISSFTSWARTLAEFGPGSFYANAGFADYPPGYLYVLWLVGGLADLLAPLVGTQAGELTTTLLKLPPMLADLGVAWLLHRLASGWSGGGARGGRIGLAASAIYLFNPVTWYDSALWGQTDAIGALVMLAGVAFLVRGHPEAAAVTAVVAGLVKPQFGVVLAPLVGAVLLRRYILADDRRPVRLLSSAVAAVAVFYALIIPFGLDLSGFLELVSSTAGGYPYLSVNAYNPWALFGADGTPPLATSGAWSDDDVPFLGPLPAVLLGTALLGAGFAYALGRVLWRADRRSIVLAAVFLSLAFFILPTRVHERYVFPVFAFLPLLAAVDRRWLWVTVALAAGSFMNLHGVLTIESYGTENVTSLPFGEAFRSFLGVTTSAVLQTAAFAFAAWQLRPGARPHIALARAPHDDEHAARQPEHRAPGADAVPPQPERLGREHPARESAAGAAPLVEHAGYRAATRATAGSQPAALAWLIDRFRVLPVRRDRSAELHGETGGRFDRLDVLLVAALLLSAMTLRTWRLAEPYDMHFDEVYHARTATEFLQHWRYGIPHDIYEYTHPHLAKYAIAAGIVLFGNDRVVGEGDLGVPVSDAAIEQRWSPPDAPGQRNGDRLIVATGSEIRTYDLLDRELEATIPFPAVAVTVDPDTHDLYAVDGDGELAALATSVLDAARGDGAPIDASAVRPLGRLAPPFRAVERLVAIEGTVVGVLDRGAVAGLDTEDDAAAVQVGVPGAADAVALPSADRVLVDVAAVDDAGAVADVLAEALSDEPARLEELFASAAADRVLVDAYLTEDERSAVQAGIDDASLPGVAIEPGAMVAVAGSAGVTVLDAASLETVREVALEEPSTGLALVRNLDDPTLYVASGERLELVTVADDTGPAKGGSVTMPATVHDVLWDEPSNLVHATGRTPDGSAATVYVVEPHGNAVFADAALPFEPEAVALDIQPDRPSDDRQDLIALDATGRQATVDVGSHAFSWRIMGVIAGALTTGLLYVLARFLFRRRSVAIIAGSLALVEGMFFANARIAMNDTYVTLFIVAAMTVFAPLYLGRWRRPLAIALGLPLVGLLLGLALSAKWVGAYAIGAVALLVLLRSALGRIVALGGMVALTGILGYLGLRPHPDVADPRLNFLFLGLMVLLTVVLAVAIVVRPVRFSPEELRFSVGGPAVVGALLAGAGILLAGSLPPEGLLSGPRLVMAGSAFLFLGAAAYAVTWLATRAGLGPLVRSRRDPEGAPEQDARSSPAPVGWLRPGWAGGIPWTYAMLCLTLVPLAVYLASYLPWIALGNRWTETLPPGHTGQTFFELTRSMYEYHDDLRATHAASSPWWAWPFDLKPVWFYQDSFANGTTGIIYDAGNLVVFWLGVPAVIFAAWQAWRRRSLALTLVVVAIAALWLPWARIDRATFQYHVFTSLPFTVLALAYFLAELWHGPSPRTWLFARAAAAFAIVGAPLLWLLRVPLCGLAGTGIVNPNGVACGAIERSVTLDGAALAAVIVVLAGAVVVGWQSWKLARVQGRAAVEAPDARRSGMAGAPAAIIATLAGAALVIAVAGSLASGEPVATLTVHAEAFALLSLALLAVPAYAVLRARDSRRFVVGAVGAAVLWFAIWYPYISGLPVPTPIAHAYLVFLSTYNYDFQFAVNMDEPYRGAFVDAGMVALLAVIAVTAVAAMFAAHAWRSTVPRRQRRPEVL